MSFDLFCSVLFVAEVDAVVVVAVVDDVVDVAVAVVDVAVTVDDAAEFVGDEDASPPDFVG